MQPVWFALDRTNVERNEEVAFDLQVKVDIRGSATKAKLPFLSSFYLSLDDRLDIATDIKVSGMSSVCS